MYENMTFEHLQEVQLERIREDVDKREGSVIWDATAAASVVLSGFYFQLGNYIDLVFPDTSAGSFLDRFTAPFHTPRRQAVKAVRKGAFDREVPVGSRFSTAGGQTLTYAVLAPVGEEGGKYYYQLECEQAGRGGNEYTGSIIPVEYLPGLGKAELLEVIVSGSDIEPDDDYRDRFLAKVCRPSTSGNANDYYNWAMSCNNVGAAKVFPLDFGPGTVGVAITNGDKAAAGTALVESVAAYIESVRPIGATVTVYSATEKAVNISASIRLASGAPLGMVQDTFREAARAYLQENAFETDYISLARMGNLLLSVSGVEDYTSMLLNGEAANVEVGAREVAIIGTVRLEVITGDS